MQAVWVLCSLIGFVDAGFRDESALIQSAVRVHDTQALADFQDQGFTFRRTVSAVEPGSSVTFKIGHGCKTVDQYGSNDCTLAWASKNDVLMKMHLANGLRSGDRVALSLKSSAKVHNDYEAGLADIFDGQTIEASGSCQACEGTCIISAAKRPFIVNVTFPTVADSKELCNNIGNATDFVLANTSVIPLGPLGTDLHVMYLRLRGNLDTSVTLESKDGTKRVAESFHFGLGDSGSSSSTSPVLLQLEEHRQSYAQQTRSLLGAVQEAFSGVLTNAAKNLFKPTNKKVSPAKSAAKKGAKGLKSLNVKTQIFFIENGNGKNVTLKDAKYCKSTDSKGSVDCHIPFGSAINLAGSVHIGSVIEQGATIDLKIEPKVDGMLGAALSQVMKPVKLTLPLCGAAGKVVLMGQTVPVQPPKCGPYALDSDVPPTSVTVPDLSQIPLKFPKEMSNIPFLPTRFDQLPPFKLAITATLKHKDSTPILSMLLEVGLK